MIENQILGSLLTRDAYARKVVPFISEEYFQSVADKIVFLKIRHYLTEYNSIPTKEALAIELSNDAKLSETEYSDSIDLVDKLSGDPDTNEEWLIDQTEKFCQEKAVYNAIMESIHIIDGEDEDKTKQAIPEILSNALSVSFDNSVGHDFMDDADARYDFYHHKEERIPFDLDYFNRITKGGIPKKSLSIILAGTGVGKSLAMCHFAAANMMQGKNVLYITMEMAEERIAERIDANLLNVPVDELINLPKAMYTKKINKLREDTPGRLIIKEYPTASAHVGHFRHLVNELSIKRKFIPDVIYIDYLNICSSSRFKAGSNVNSYTVIKAIAEELRGLAVEKNVPVISATQTTRSGFTNSDIGLEDTSESFGLPATADFMFALISTDELQELNQLMVKQLKNRYSDPSSNKRFVIGVDRPKMRLYDVEETAQHDLIDSPSPQSSGKPVAPDGFNPSKKFGSKDFSNLFGEGQ
jgi:replicative DNA helicase|tara:strand:+ start:5740 stop:7149 length:1410 start_codon:yes stop_codon:yes gene_type:complete